VAEITGGFAWRRRETWGYVSPQSSSRPERNRANDKVRRSDYRCWTLWIIPWAASRSEKSLSWELELQPWTWPPYGTKSGLTSI
jgi:hypothetical protein